MRVPVPQIADLDFVRDTVRLTGYDVEGNRKLSKGPETRVILQGGSCGCWQRCPKQKLDTWLQGLALQLWIDSLRPASCMKQRQETIGILLPLQVTKMAAFGQKWVPKIQA